MFRLVLKVILHPRVFVLPAGIHFFFNTNFLSAQEIMKSTNTGRLSYKFLTFVIFLMCNISFFLCFVFTFINAAFSYLLHFYIFVFLLAAFAFCVVIYINILN